MDLLCTENIAKDYDNERHRSQQQQQQQHNILPLGHSRSNTSPYSSSSSSGYNSATSNSSSSTTCIASCCSNKKADHNTATAAGDEAASGGAPELCSVRMEQGIQQQQQEQAHHQQYPQSVRKILFDRNLDHVNSATKDPTFLSDRCLENALKDEEKRTPTLCSTYFRTVQKDITPPMRKIVAEWMMEVCAEEKCQEEVVLLALDYMDRFLSSKSVRKTHLQILAAACLLLASKLREPCCRALSAELLVFYTDNSIHKGDLIKWELLVLSRLGWDLSSVTPLDFLELLLIRLPIRSSKCPDLNVDKVRQHAQAFISLAAKEHHFSMYTASTIAASSIAAALSGLNWHLRTGHNLRYLLNRLTDLTSVEQNYLHDCMMKMEAIFEEHSRNLQPYLADVEAHHHQNQSQALQTPTQQQQLRHNHGHTASGNVSVNAMLPDLTQTCKMQANAQKDVRITHT